MQRTLIVTCEHGGNRVPRPYERVFLGHEAVLQTHRGWDIGAALVAERFAPAFGAPLFVARVSRLLVDLNRSVGHPHLFSEMTRALPADAKELILAEHYTPHRSTVEEAVRRARKRGLPVVHVAIHSFTPVLNGVKRRADVAFLYDPARRAERELCLRWQRALEHVDPRLVVRRNYPYRGASDGFSTALRKANGPAYLGIEIEINQRILRTNRAAEKMAHTLAVSFEAASELRRV